MRADRPCRVDQATFHCRRCGYEVHADVHAERVYDELATDKPAIQTLPVDTAIEEGWTTVGAPLEFSQSIVSRTMDGVQRHIANADDRPADEIKRADAALAALAAQHLSIGTATAVYTTLLNNSC